MCAGRERDWPWTTLADWVGHRPLARSAIDKAGRGREQPVGGKTADKVGCRHGQPWVGVDADRF